MDFYSPSIMYLQGSTSFRGVVLVAVQLLGCCGGEYDSGKPDQVAGDLLQPSNYPLND
jgi:hypothetical protein